MDHANDVTVQINEPFAEAVDPGWVKSLATRTLAAADPGKPAALTVVITDDATIQRLNRRYLGIDATTDVLAFSQTEGPVLPRSGAGPPYLGDVVVSYERAEAQAEEYKEPLVRELGRLVVHGTLHLLGYDDHQETERQQMWELQERILATNDYQP